MSAEQRVRTLGIELPPAPKALGTYASTVRSGNLVFVAGQGPMRDGRAVIAGTVGADVSLAQGQEAARLACLNALAVLREALGSLDRIRRVVQARVYVCCTDAFHDQPKVANGATDLLRDLFGDQGIPARAAVGVNSLPANIPVELELVVEAE